MPSARDRSISSADATCCATERTSSGSNFAESNSFATTRAMLTPSDNPGGDRGPPANACPTASLRRLDDRDRYSDSKLESARSTMIVSGLEQAHKGRMASEVWSVHAPLVRLRVDGVRLHGNLGKERVEEAEEAGVAGA